MGIYNRDYMRDEDHSDRVWSGGSSSWPPVCKWLIISTAVVYLLQIFAGPSIQGWLSLDGGLVLRGQIWRLVTYAFCHSPEDLLHILFNMLFLWWFGKTLEQRYGSLEFLLFYLVAAVTAGFAFLGLNVVTGDISRALGASGSVMAVMMLYAALFPRQKIYIWMVLPVEIRWLVLAYVLFDLFPVLGALSGNAISDGVAHAAHLGGLLFGFLYWKFRWNLSHFWSALLSPLAKKSSSRKPAKKTGRKIIQMPGSRPAPAAKDPGESEAGFEKEVDRILQKIVDHGNSSLTEKERKTLVDASERMKNRDK